MPALQVRDFPDQLYEELRLCAKHEYRSIAQQTIVIIQDYLSRENKRLAEAERPKANYAEHRRQVFERIDSLPLFKLPEDFPTPQQIIREMRDQR